MKKTALLFYFLAMGFSLIAQEQWERYTALADSLDSKYRFEEALIYRTKALESATSQAKPTQQLLHGLKLFTQAEHDFAQTKNPHPEAYASMGKATDILQENNAPAERMSRAYYILSQRAFDYMYQAEDAEKHLDMAIDYFGKTLEKDTIYLVEMMQFSGYMKIVSENRKFDEAIHISENALGLLEELGTKGVKDDDLKAKLFYNLSLVHGLQFLNIPQKEYQYTLESQKVLLTSDNLDIELLVLTQRRLAAFERDYGNYDKSKGYMNQAMRLYNEHRNEMRAKVGFKLELALYRANLATLIDNEEEEEVLKNLAQVEQLVQNNTFDEVEKGNYKGILNFITAYYLDVNPNLQEAKKYNDRALAIPLDSKKAPYSLESYNQTARTNKVRLLLLRQQNRQAMASISNIEKAAGYMPDKLLISLKARSLLGLGKADDAIGVIDQLLIAFSEDNRGFSLPKSNVKDFHPSHAITDTKTLIQLAEAFREYYGKYTVEEEKLYWMALVQMQSNIENTPLNKELKNTFDKITSGLMNVALERNFSTEENNRLLTFMEVLTSQDLVNNFLLKREIAGNTQLYKMVEEEQYIRSYITFLKKEYQKSKDEKTKQQLFEKELELKKNNEQLTAQYRQSKLFTVPEIDMTVNNGKNIIKFKVAGNDLFKTRLHDGKLTYQKITDYQVLKGEIEQYLTHLNNLETPVSIIKKQGEHLYKKLFTDDFNTSIPTVIIPDDILHYLPFDLLVKDNAYLVENYTISYAPNFYFLNTNSGAKNSSNRKKVAFFSPKYSGTLQESQLAVRGEAYSLLGAEAEVNEIASFVSGKKYVGNSASKTNFKSVGTDISILHLAMHSNLNDDDPELSNLLFSNTEPDYEMYISELYGLNFNGDLAVLSACNTGIGGFKDGGNLVSMHHAFTTAGIPATIASLWNAPDQSTKEIMVVFYKNLQQGMDKATALQLAKLSYLKNTKDENLQHPFYWAGFVLSGDDSPVQLASSPFWDHPMFVFVLLGIAILIAVVLFVRKRKKY